MNPHDLIFSKGRYKICRHLAFWIAWLIFASVVQLTNFNPGSINAGDIIIYQIIRSITRMPSILIFCYVTIYLFIPRFLIQKKYFQFVLYYFIFLCLLYLFNYYIQSQTYGIPKYIASRIQMSSITPFLRKFFSFYSNINFTGALPTCCMMLVIKYYKDWHANKIKNDVLIRENKQAELQLLKAQIHPHFLFNTLNNIYSFTLTESTKAADLVNMLSGMMDYITSEGEKTLVPLEKEIQFIKDYIGLENVRYGDRLKLSINIFGNYHDMMVTPLLMIPFVENSFKHGASEMRGHQWINLDISIDGQQLDFKLSNSKPGQEKNKNGKRGIGLSNVQKRLDLLYPGKHILKLESTNDKYSVHMQVSLHQSAEPAMTTKLIIK